MKKCLLALPFAVVLAQAQAPAPDIKPDAVVVTMNGRAVTRAELERMLLPLPPASKATIMRDPQAFLQNLAWLEAMVKLAEEKKLEQQSPYRERIEQLRSQILAQALVDDYSNHIHILPEVQRKYYDANRAKYKQVKGRLIFVPVEGSGKKALTEAEAKTRAETIVKQARMGADFVKLVREYSEDPVTKAKDGLLDETITQGTAKIPEPMRNAMLTLKAKGEITNPVRLPNGFYIFQATEVLDQPYDEVRDDIFKELQNAEVQKWVDGLRKSSSAKVENPAYFQMGAQQGPK